MRLTLTLMLLFSVGAFAQDATKTSFVFEKSKTLNMSQLTYDWNVNLQHIKAPKPGVNTLRQELARKKQEIMQRYPRTDTSTRSTAASAPSIGNSFEGNIFQGVPNDNDLAISRDSIVVSVTNRRIHIYNGKTQEELITRSLANLVADLDISGSKYDPKVIYDPNNDRFIIIFLNGFTWQTSQIMMAFSETNDPTGDWHLYAIPGNPLDNETWSDYPVVGISGKDLYIGINTFFNGSQNNSGFVETCLWQIGLKEGYIGFDLNTNYYSNILPQSKKIFNICPIPAAAESDAENMYLLSNRNTDAENDSIFLLEVTGRVSNANTQLNVRTISSDRPYVLPVAADQPGDQWFDTNDSRILGGYLLNGRIYFVQSCTDPANGRAGIYHGVIDNVSGNASMVSRIYSQPDMDYGFPNISWTGTFADEEQSMISFNHSSETDFGGFSAMFVDAGLNASDRIEIKEGFSTVNVMADTLERWGDYSGSQRMYNQPGVVWAVGSFGNPQGGHGTWIAEVFSPSVATSVAENAVSTSTSVYPNPFINDVSVEFNLRESDFVKLELVDANGKLVRLLLEDRIKAGLNRISFNTDGLDGGIYFLIASNADARLFSKQLIKQ